MDVSPGLDFSFGCILDLYVQSEDLAMMPHILK